MNHFTQHIPPFVEIGDEKPPSHDFETLDELLNLKEVKRFTEDPDFSYFAISKPHLMAVFNDGYRWWVIGRIKYSDNLDLPEWKPKYYDSKLSKAVHGTIRTSKRNS